MKLPLLAVLACLAAPSFAAEAKAPPTDADRAAKLLLAEEDGKRLYAAESLDAAGLKAAAKTWAEKNPSQALALASVTASPKAGRRLAELLRPWRAKRASDVAGVGAFFWDAAGHATKLLEDGKVRDEILADSIPANDELNRGLLIVPHGVRAVDRAKKVTDGAPKGVEFEGGDRAPEGEGGGQPGNDSDGSGQSEDDQLRSTNVLDSNVGVNAQLPRGFKRTTGSVPTPGKVKIVTQTRRVEASGFNSFWKADEEVNEVYEEDERGVRRLVSGVGDLSESGRAELDKKILEQRSAALERQGITERRAPEAYRNAMQAEITDEDRQKLFASRTIEGTSVLGQAGRSVTGGSFVGQPLGAGDYAWTAADGLLNPMLYILPGIGSSLSRATTGATVKVTQVPEKVEPQPEKK